MRVLPCVMLILGCLIVAGCGTFAKQPNAKTAPANPGADPRLPWPPPAGKAPAPPAPGAPAPAWPTATPTAASGLLAGQILDVFNRAPPAIAYIQVSTSQEGDKGAPIEVAADDQGYFTIQGLQPGKGYRLLARSKYGDKLMAGSAFATPPNPRVVIRIGEENANASTPPPPPPPVMPKGRPQPAMNWPGSVGQEGDWSPIGPNASQQRPAGLGAPIPVGGEEQPPTSLQPPVPVPPTYRPEDIARGLARQDPPTANIPGPNRTWQGADALPPLPPINGPMATGPAQVPSCVLVGRQLHNLALNDIEGQPWEFKDHRARLTLVDFWGTWCTHCLHTIPHLNVMQERYGPYGLQVVGIAYEDGPPQIQADKVRRVADRLRINYQILMGGDRISCPVRIQFGVASWPTLYLLDGNGRIIWQSVGLQPQALTELDVVIRQQLGMR